MPPAFYNTTFFSQRSGTKSVRFFLCCKQSSTWTQLEVLLRSTQYYSHFSGAVSLLESCNYIMMSWPKNITKHHMTTTWSPKSIKIDQNRSKNIKKHHKTSQNITKHQSDHFWSNLVFVWSFFDVFWCFLMFFDRFWSILIDFDHFKTVPELFFDHKKRSLLITFDQNRSKSIKNDQNRSD